MTDTILSYWIYHGLIAVITNLLSNSPSFEIYSFILLVDMDDVLNIIIVYLIYHIYKLTNIQKKQLFKGYKE